VPEKDRIIEDVWPCNRIVRPGKGKQMIMLVVVASVVACVFAILLTLGLAMNRGLALFGVASFMAAAIASAGLFLITSGIPSIIIRLKHKKEFKRLYMEGSQEDIDALWESIHGQKFLILQRVGTILGIVCMFLWVFVLTFVGVGACVYKNPELIKLLEIFGK